MHYEWNFEKCYEVMSDIEEWSFCVASSLSSRTDSNLPCWTLRRSKTLRWISPADKSSDWMEEKSSLEQGSDECNFIPNETRTRVWNRYFAEVKLTNHNTSVCIVYSNFDCYWSIQQCKPKISYPHSTGLNMSLHNNAQKSEPKTFSRWNFALGQTCADFAIVSNALLNFLRRLKLAKGDEQLAWAHGSVNARHFGGGGGERADQCRLFLDRSSGLGHLNRHVRLDNQARDGRNFSRSRRLHRSRIRQQFGCRMLP